LCQTQKHRGYWPDADIMKITVKEIKKEITFFFEK
jgi:hypothetical protein